MKLRDYVSEEKLTAEIIREGPRIVMGRWCATAIEITRTRYEAIGNLHRAYAENSDSELMPYKVISFIEGVLEILENDEERGRLLRTEGFGSRKS